MNREEMLRSFEERVARCRLYNSIFGVFQTGLPPGIRAISKALFLSIVGSPRAGVRYLASSLATHIYRVPKLDFLVEVLTRILRIKTFYGSYMYGDQDPCLETVGILGGVEIKLTRYLLKVLERDEVFYDVRAHVGFYTLLASRILEEGEVHAFVPNPFVYAFLKTNVEGLANVRANPYALSDRCGTATLYFPKSFLTA